jgi:chaperonin GroEL
MNSEKDMECVLDSPLIFMFNGTLRDVNGVANLIGQIAQDRKNMRPIVFVAHDYSDEMKALFALNMKQGSIKMVPVMTLRDGTPMGRELMLADLAAYTNGKVFDVVNLKDAKPTDLGDCDKFRVSRWQAVFIGQPDQKTLKERIDNIKSQMEKVDKEIDAEVYKERIARLTGGITTIFIGGLSDLEVRETKARVEDAVCAVRSALKQGVVPGGAKTILDMTKLDIHPVLRQAFCEPLRRLLDNAGLQEGAMNGIACILLSHRKKVYDVLNHKMVNPWKAGILDPAKVIDSAIGNALSVASILVTLGGVVVVARDVNLENQLEMSENAFANMMNAGGEQ